MKLAQRILVANSSERNRTFKNNIYAIGIQGPIGHTFFIEDQEYAIGLSGVYEIEEQDYPLATIIINSPNPGEKVVVDYLYKEDLE